MQKKLISKIHRKLSTVNYFLKNLKSAQDMNSYLIKENNLMLKKYMENEQYLLVIMEVQIKTTVGYC